MSESGFVQPSVFSAENRRDRCIPGAFGQKSPKVGAGKHTQCFLMLSVYINGLYSRDVELIEIGINYNTDKIAHENKDCLKHNLHTNVYS